MNKPLRGGKGDFLFVYDAAVSFQIQFYLTITCQFTMFCQLFREKFNIMSTLFIHQAPTLPQKIDSREGLF